jgi:Sel1 repeat
MFLRLATFTFVLFFYSSISKAYVLPPPNCTYEKFDDCLHNGNLPYVVVYGEIVYSDLSVFKRIDQELQRNSSFPIVYLDSGGGKIDAAIRIGRILRKNKATARSGNPIQKHENTECSSACVMIAAGATERYLTHIGLHSASRMNDQMKLEPSSEEVLKVSREYFEVMGIDERLSTISDTVPFDDLLDFTYEPRAIGKYQYIVQLGFYQGETFDDDDLERDGIVIYPNDPYSKQEEIAALNGSPAALAALVDRYMNGMIKYKPEPQKAFEWLHYGLDHRDKRSAHMLAYYYSKTDKVKSIEIYKKAAEMGAAGAQNNLGWAYYTGKGVKRSVADAVFWITKAAEQGEPFAYGSLCEIAADGNAFKDDNVQAFKWCHLALWEMPKGKARDASVAGMSVISKRITVQERALARQLIEDWNPLVKTQLLMGNKEDKVKPDHERWLYK